MKRFHYFKLGLSSASLLPALRLNVIPSEPSSKQIALSLQPKPNLIFSSPLVGFRTRWAGGHIRARPGVMCFISRNHAPLLPSFHRLTPSYVDSLSVLRSSLSSRQTVLQHFLQQRGHAGDHQALCDLSCRCSGTAGWSCTVPSGVKSMFTFFFFKSTYWTLHQSFDWNMVRLFPQVPVSHHGPAGWHAAHCGAALWVCPLYFEYASFILCGSFMSTVWQIHAMFFFFIYVFRSAVWSHDYWWLLMIIDEGVNKNSI